MPAEFPSAVTGPLNTMRTAARTATSFASNVVSLLTALVGANNPFGSAATREAGTEAGEVPVLNAAGRIEPSLLPSATDSVRGAVMLARNLQDGRAGVVATAAQVSAHATAATTGLDASNFTMTALANDVVFTAPAVGMLVIAGAGGGGHRPPGFITNSAGTAPREAFLAPASLGVSGGATTLRYGDNAASASAPSIVVPGGHGGGRPKPSVAVFQLLTVTPDDDAPQFALLLDGKGAPGGGPGAFASARGGTLVSVGYPGGPGALLIAKVSAGGRYRVSIGSGGAGAAAITGLNSAAGERSDGGVRGLDGYAFYVRLD